MIALLRRLWCALRGHPDRFCLDEGLTIYTVHCPDCGKTWKEDRP